jgi:hypothetical protein
MEKYELELKRQKEYLKRLERKDPEVVYHCPVCNTDVLKYQYDLKKQGMCNDCYAKDVNRRMKEKASQLIGAKIMDVSIQDTTKLWRPQGFNEAHELAHVTKLVVKLKDGKIITLNEEERAPALLL